MHKRIAASNGVVYYTSALLESIRAPHCFSTRIGGVSEGPFHSLNLGNPSRGGHRDKEGNLDENYSRLHMAVNVVARSRAWAFQSHGASVLSISDPDSPDIGKHADAVCTSSPKLMASVRYADCAPVLIASGDGASVGAVHAGWRGIVEGVIEATLKHFTEPSTLIVAIGPCIGVNHFQVGDEVVAAFVKKFGADAPIYGSHRRSIDLRGAIRLTLLSLGVLDTHIDANHECTHANADEFFSERRDGLLTGRMAAMIGPRDR